MGGSDERSQRGDTPKLPPEFFPCMRALGVGELAMLAVDTVYCPICYDYAETMWPALANVAKRFQLKRGLTCGGGYAED